MLTIADGGGRGGPGYHFSEALLNGVFIFPLFISLFPSQDAVFQFFPLLIVFTTALPGTERNVYSLSKAIFPQYILKAGVADVKNTAKILGIFCLILC